MKKERFTVTGMTCAACQANVTRTVAKLNGVKSVNVDLLGGSMTAEYDESVLTRENICAAVSGIGYGAVPEDVSGASKKDARTRRNEKRESARKERHAMGLRLVWSLILLLPLMYLAMGGMLGLPLPPQLAGAQNALPMAFTQLLLSAVIILINRGFYVRGFKALWKRVPNMDSLVALGSAASLLYGIFAIYAMMFGQASGNAAQVETYRHQLYFESAAMILALVTVGKYLEARSKVKTSSALDALAALTPDTALVVRDGAEIEIAVSELRVGDILSVKPGMRIPADGIVTEGSGAVDQSAITGESAAVEKLPGDSVSCATVNRSGAFRMRAEKVGDDTAVSGIIRLVDEASGSKAPIAGFADKVSGVFVPAVIGISLLTLIIWLACGSGFAFALTRAIAVLVISCPCSLGLATPVAVMCGTGRAAEMGILFKSASALEELHRVDTVVLDKTGTITTGCPVITDLILAEGNTDARAFLRCAAALESGSEHPLAQAILAYAEKSHIRFGRADNFASVPGRGVSGVIAGEEWRAGNAAFTNATEATVTLAESLARDGKTPLIFTRNGAFAGILAASDALRPTSRAAIKQLKKRGIRVIMLTGDNHVTAEAFRRQLGLDEAVSEVLPAQKEAQIRALQSQGRVVAMVGDGINDAPALTRADTGIAIGAGTDIAVDSADVVLMKSDLVDVVRAIDLSRRTMKNIRENLFWALGYNSLCIPVAAGALYPALGWALSPMLGSAAMSLSSVCVVTNALRLRLFRPAQEETDVLLDNPGLAPLEGEDKEMTKVLKVEGMMCMHCVAHVKKALEAVAGVASADVDLKSKTATVTLTEDVADEVLAKAVTDEGYEVV